jgi:hypothetical protein
LRDVLLDKCERIRAEVLIGALNDELHVDESS